MHAYLLWIAVCCYAAHIYEEALLGWLSWAQDVLKFKNLSWRDFYLTNAIVVILGICCAMVGWSNPAFSLILPGLMLINALFLHILPTIIKRRYSPGLFTAIVLFLPVGTLCFYVAYLDQALTYVNGSLSMSLSALVMAAPMMILHIRDYMHIKD
jgi:hypothetical protein